MNARVAEAGADPRQPLVSIVVPTYNRAALLGETLDSLLAQEYPRVELIVVDDGSTDATAEVIARYAARAPERFRAVRQENGGQSAAVNHGFALARGEFVMMISSDDPQPPGLVAPLVAALLDAPDVVLVYPDWEMIDDEGRYLQSLETRDYDFAEMVRWHECVLGPGAMVRRSRLDEIGGWNIRLRYAPDYEWYLRAGLVGPFKRVPLPLARWRAHAGSITTGRRGEAMAREMLAVTEEFFARPDLPEEIRAVRLEAFRNAYVLGALTLSDQLEGPGARFSIVDRIQPLKTSVDLRREPSAQAPLVVLEQLHRLAADNAATIAWLHGEVAARDKTIVWLHEEVAARDRRIAAGAAAPPAVAAVAPPPVTGWRARLADWKRRCGF